MGERREEGFVAGVEAEHVLYCICSCLLILLANSACFNSIFFCFVFVFLFFVLVFFAPRHLRRNYAVAIDRAAASCGMLYLVAWFMRLLCSMM